MTGNAPGASSRAWLVVLGASLSAFCTVGLVNAFGVFQSYYKTSYLSDKSESDIGWIGSANVFFVFGLAPIAGILVDKFGPRILIGIGSIGQLIAIFMTSLCTEYYQFFLAQAVLLGASMAFATWPAVGVVGRHLPHRRGLALGIVVGGSSVGGVIWPIMLDRLLDADGVGFPWTMRIVGFVMMPLLAIATATISDVKKSPTIQAPDAAVTEADAKAEDDVSPESAADSSREMPKTQHRQKTDFSLLRNKSFILLCSGVSVAYLGLFGPFFFVSSYATQYGYASDHMAFYLIAILNAASLFGRILPGMIADKYGHFNLCALALYLSAITAFCWPAVHNLAGLIVFVIAYGFTSGALLSLQGACAGKIAPPGAQGTAAGFLFGPIAITALAGTPVCGQLVSQYGYVDLSIFCGVTLAVGGILVTLARLSIKKQLLANI